MAKGMGFKAAAASVAKKSGMPAKQAKAVIAAGARNASPAAKKANPNLKKVAPAKKAGAKKANPFAKSMSDAACPPGSMSGGPGVSAGMGAAKKVLAKKAAPKAMGEVGVRTPRGQRNAVTAQLRKSGKKLPSQGRINPPITGKGSASTSGSDVN